MKLTALRPPAARVSFERSCRGLRKQTLRIMKLTALLLLIGCLHVCAKGSGQKVTLSRTNAPLQVVLMDIYHQTGISYGGKHELLEKAEKVTISVKNVPLEQALAICFKNQPLAYSIQDNVILITEKPSASKIAYYHLVTIDVKGRVINENEEPLHGITVKVKGGNRMTQTDGNGEFYLTNSDANATLIFTGVNVEPFEYNVAGQMNIVIHLKPKINKLDEVQVIAYGTTTKRLNTGNVSTIKSTEIEQQPVNNPLLALEGRVPGLFITQSTGVPGSGISVRLQGQNSLQGGNDPLYVIDGVPYTSQLLPNVGQSILGSNGNTNAFAQTGGGNPLNFLNPADIESVDVLKDADATAIYGSRAANGAILITTKKGKTGSTSVDLNLQSGWAKVTRTLPLLNTQQYLEMRHEAFRNDGTTPGSIDFDINGTWDTTRYTDWQKVLIGGTAHYTDVHASMSGGNANTNFLAATGYRKETSVFPGNLADQKGSLHFNINHISTNKRLQMQLSGNYMVDRNQLIGTDLTNTAIRLAPDGPALYNTDGTLNWSPLLNGNSTWINPLSNLYSKYNFKINNLIGNALLSYQVLPGLEIRSSLGYTNLQTNETSIAPLVAMAPELRASSTRVANFANGNISSWNIEPQVAYTHRVGKGTLDALVGTTILQTGSTLQRLFGIGFNSDLVLQDIKSASTVIVIQSIASTYRYNALFGRINYNLQNKYIINLTARRDGSSRFGSGNLFHNFGSIGAAWLFSNERFISQDLHFISFGKIRVSYGTTGNDQIGDYQFMNLYNSVSVPVAYQGATGLAPSGLPNPYLQWEETRKLQFGLDLGFLKDRILLNANYYYNRSSNLLQGYPLPYITGFNTIVENFPAIVQNKGLEITLTTKIIDAKKFTWASSVNLTIPQNKLVAFPNLASSSYANSYVIGRPVTIKKVYSLLGVDQTTGLYLFRDGHGSSTSSALSTADRIAIVNVDPEFYGGFQNSFSYKGFELEVMFQFVKQISNLNYQIGNQPGRFASSTFGGLISNQPVYVLQRWQKQGDISSIQKFSASYPSTISTPFNNANISDLTTDASYVRLKNICISWQLPKKWKQRAHFKNCKLYMQGQNLLTITHFKGMDPESQSVLSLPPLKVITLGLQVGL